MSQLALDTIHKSYGQVHAVRGISLDIPEGEFVVLVGPSGCGKSTLLRAIAGLEDISSGTIRLGSRDITHAQPRARNIAMVFQSYALYPYLSVYENIAFGLRARKAPQSEIDSRVRWAADILDITDYLQRFPRELSGGQRQRVAIGRAIVREAELYLFDEPLSNLDAKLRDGMREEIKRLHRRIGKTFVYVTHDQIEAMTLAERIVLLRDGEIAQQGAPLDLFERPANTFVAGFLGSPAMNMIPATVSPDGTRLDLPDGQNLALSDQQVAMDLKAGRQILWGVRPEQFRISRRGPNALKATVDIVQPTGSRSFASFMIGDAHAVAEVDAHQITKANQVLTLGAAMDRTVLFDPQSGEAIGPNTR